jgi:hypothetical protein
MILLWAFFKGVKHHSHESVTSMVRLRFDLCSADDLRALYESAHIFIRECERELQQRRPGGQAKGGAFEGVDSFCHAIQGGQR